MDVEQLTANYPRLFHMAAADSWPSIAAHGLLLTRDIVASSALTDAERASVLTQPRPRPVPIDHPALGTVTLRDQSPLHRHILEAVLIDMTVPQWLAVLNDRIYFWLHPRRLTALLRSRPNRDAEHDVLTIDTARLVAAHHDQIRLSAINSGATHPALATADGANRIAVIRVQLVKYILHLLGRSAWPRRGARLLVSRLIARRAMHGGSRSSSGRRLTIIRRHGAQRRFAGEHQPGRRSSSGGCP